MGIAGKKNRQWLLPALIVLALIFVLGLFLPGLIYPNQAVGNEQTLADTATSTSTTTPTQALHQDNLPTPVENLLAVTTSPSPSTGKCTYTYFYWRTHPDAWLIENIVIGPLSYDQAQAIAILESNELDARTLLLQQFFAALLNSLSGADAAVIQATLKQASDWINAHPSESLIAESDRAQAMTLVLALTDYNTGVSGPGHCPDEPFTPTPQPTPTITQTPTRTPAPTSTRRPATPTSEDDGGGGPTKAPTEPQPTDKPTDQPTQPPKPTDKPTPKPTDRPTPPVPTPEPPTNEPPPTPEPPPPDTPSPNELGWSLPPDWLNTWVSATSVSDYHL